MDRKMLTMFYKDITKNRNEGAMVKKHEKNQDIRVNVKAKCTQEEWQKFKDLVKPIPVEVALGQMIKTAIESETKPFKDVVEQLLKEAFRS